MTRKSDAKFIEKLTWFQIWHEEFGEFLPSHPKSENFFPMVYFVQYIQDFNYKNTEKLSFTTLSRDAKFE